MTDDLPQETIDQVSFAQWLRWAFDHPVSDPAWYWSDNVKWLEPKPPQTVDYLTKVFEDPANALSSFSDEQINQGLWFIAHSACSSHMSAITDEDVPLEDQIRCVRSIYSLYEKLFAKRCSSSLSRKSELSKPLNSICYMWWDLAPIYGRPKELSHSRFDEEVLEVMKRTLELKSDACREGALHGLGHWHDYYPVEIEKIIDTFLEYNSDIRPELAEYAANARTGKVP